MNSQTKPITIILFGRTGVGKSSLANQMLGQKIFPVGETLISETDSVASKVFDWPLDPSIKVKIVDTPGFADNRKDMTNGVLLSRILDFLKSLQDGLNIAIFCLSAKTRIDQHDTQELEMLGLLLGQSFFDHVCLAVTQGNTLISPHREKVCKGFVDDLPGIFLQNGLPPFTHDKILFADFDNLEKSFMEPLTNFIRTTGSYVPQVSEEINPNDPKSIQRFLAKPEVKQVMASYENQIAAQATQLEQMQKTIIQKAEESQRLIRAKQQEQEALQRNLAAIRQQLNSTQTQSENHRRQLRDFERGGEAKLQSLRREMENLNNHNQNLQRLMDAKQNSINALNARIVEIQNARRRPPQIIFVSSGGGGGGCNIF